MMMATITRPRCSTILALALVAGPGSTARAQAPKPTQAQVASGYPAQVRPIVAKYCVGCHGGDKPKHGLDLAKYADDPAVARDLKTWQKVLDAVESGSMPPEGKPQPSEVESRVVVHYLQALISKSNCSTAPDPGRVTLRRLNREEYNNTIRDLFGLDLRPADDFPSDDVGYGFDNIGDVLSLPPLLMEKYLAAAESVADAAIVADDRPRGPTRRFKAEALAKPGANGNVHGESGFFLFYSDGEVGVDHPFPKSGQYLVRARAFGQRAGDELPKLAFRVDGKAVRSFDVKAEEDAPAVFETTIKAKATVDRLSVAFTNDAYFPENPNPSLRDRNLAVEYLEIVGPLHTVNDPPDSHRRIIFRRPGPKNHREVAREILAKFATRAFRRPATASEVDRLVGLVDLAMKDGERFEKGIQLAVEAVLVSPHFLYRVELETRPGAPRNLTDLELASRLSYFLWSSMPDDELIDLASRNQLRAGRNLDAQVARMLKDPKSREFVENFAGQWLQVRNLKLASPDRGRFRDFDEPLRLAMAREVEMFFNAVVREDRPISDFLDADYTFLNERLAKHYGIAGVKGDQFRRVALADRRRGGVVTMASTLTVTSNPTRTSPVKRGKWILEEILGTPPPPPPPNVADLPDEKKDKAGGTLRQRMEKHRADPNCASCHARMDPLGFSLENFDAVGAWRDQDGKAPVDASGVLPNGQAFSGPVELKAVLSTKMKPFAHCLSEKLMTYALGRGLEYEDHCVVEKVADATLAGGGKFSTLISAIVHSDPFQKRGAERSPSTP